MIDQIFLNLFLNMGGLGVAVYVLWELNKRLADSLDKNTETIKALTLMIHALDNNVEDLEDGLTKRVPNTPPIKAKQEQKNIKIEIKNSDT